MNAATQPSLVRDGAASRKIAYQTAGRGSDAIRRLMSPSDLGQHLKPFVFLDLFQGDMRRMNEAMGLHPHSGIATVTVFTQGDVVYDDPDAGRGSLAYGGVEWMRASGGVWHGKEISAGQSATMQGFQLWIALPPETENGPVDSQYIEAEAMPTVGPAHVILGQYQSAASPVRAPDDINYLLVTLQPGEDWAYTPPPGHAVGWVSVARGGLVAGETIAAGRLALFEAGEGVIHLTADAAEGATFVLGSAKPHPHDLHMGYYSVHTSQDALAQGERRIDEIRQRLEQSGDRKTASGSTPIFR